MRCPSLKDTPTIVPKIIENITVEIFCTNPIEVIPNNIDDNPKIKFN